MLQLKLQSLKRLRNSFRIKNSVHQATYFACFADGNAEIRGAGKRILDQAKQSDVFCDYFLYDKTSLLEAKELSNAIVITMREQIPGFGWAVWKPIMIRLLLSKIPEGAILFYCDSGTELVVNHFSQKRIKRVIARTEKQPVIAFKTQFPEYKYTKNIVLKLLNLIEQEDTYQIETTSIIIKNCAESRDLIDQWESLSTRDNFAWVDNSLQNEREDFLEHRRDQSTFSIIYKNAGYVGIKMNQVLGFWHEKSQLSFFRRMVFNSFFLWQIRNRTGISVLKDYQSSNFLSLAALPLQYLAFPLRKITRLRKILKQKKQNC